MIKADLITGFLGSGKTTFIKEYASYLVRRDHKVAIIASDYGAINVDRLLLEETLGDMCHLEMVIGGDADCARRRLKTKLIAMAMSGYDHVIVEPSGIYDADEFFDLIYDEPLDKWYEMGNVLTIVDAGIEKDMSLQSRYFLASQAAKAGTVIISKVNIISEDESESEKVKILDFLNKCLEEFSCVRRIEDVYLWKQGGIKDKDFEIISGSGYHSGEMVKLPIDEKSSFDSLFYFHVKTDADKITETISRMFNDTALGHILRLKGFLHDKSGEGWLEINATRHGTTVQPISVGQELFIVIGENLNHELIGNYWDEYRNTL